MAKSVAIAARVNADLDDGLERPLAAATGHSRAWLISEALRSYVRQRTSRYHVAVDEGKQKLRDRRTLNH